MNKSDLAVLLSGKEPEAVVRTLAMMAYNPSIGRVFEKGGVETFADLMVETLPKLYGHVTRERFDAIHASTCDSILSSLKTNRGETPSYGQAQKPLNVFLKVYIDFASQPDADLARKLRPFLHVPLDSLLMKFIAREFPGEYQSQVVSPRQRLAAFVASRMENTTPSRVSRALGSEFSLTGIVTREVYVAWQSLLRTLWPGKPVLLDVIWVLERSRLRKGGTGGSG